MNTRCIAAPDLEPRERAYHDGMFESQLALAAGFQLYGSDISGRLRRIAGYVRTLALELRLPADEAEQLARASLFHDVGMGSVSRSIVLKKGRLTRSELHQVAAHTRIGHQILARQDDPLMLLGASIALHHHEHFDGSGYPNGLRGTQTPLPARIVAVASVFDALSSSRPHKAAYPFHMAMDMVAAAAGAQLDPAIVAALLRRFEGATFSSRLGTGKRDTPPIEGPGSAPSAYLSVYLSDRDGSNEMLLHRLNGVYFHCPACKGFHHRQTTMCPATGFRLRRTHRLSGTTLLGKYALVRALGLGGMAVVYEARHVLTQRQLAVKLLHPSLAEDPEQLSRFFNEAGVFAAVKHRNLVEIYDADYTKDGVPFIAMELLEGEDLADVLQRLGRLSELSAASIIIEVLDALHHVHAHGIVHRDLKPENIFLLRNNRLKLLDFGLALQPRSRRRLTQEGVCMGTPEYMAPEQAEASADVDHRADLFVVGTILYELVTGCRAFAGNTPLSTMFSVVHGPYLHAKEANPNLTPALCDIIERAMAHSPAERFQTAAEFLAAVEGFVAHWRRWEPGTFILEPDA